MLTYYIHHNGGRPYKVVIKDNDIVIFGEHEWGYDNNPILGYFGVEQIFIGKSPFCSITHFSGGHGPDFDGNSILVNLDNDKYIWIGEEIKMFKPKSKIKKFVSPVGNSDVPYPYAIDSDNRYYLFIVNVCVKKYSGSEYDIYNYYRETSIMAHGTPLTIYKDQYQLTFHINPEEDWERYNKWEPDPLVVKIGGSVITEEQYCRLMNGYGEIMGFEPINWLELTSILA